MRSLIPLTLLLGFTAAAPAEPKLEKATEPAAKETHTAPKPPEPVVRNGTVEIDGKTVPYKATTGKIQIKEDGDKVKASIFYVSYERGDVKDASSRPVLFAFNGGPGSSAVWLHIGVLGPKIVKLPGNGTAAPEPPLRVEDNPLSILDACDLVFVDPVSTGYSRAENDTKPGDFYGVDEDINSLGDFIRRWISEHDRWASPKYLLGESYGGMRVAGLSEHLQARYGMNLNGVVLMSSLLDMTTLRMSPGNDISYLIFLPAFTGVAHYHGKITGDRDALIQQSKEFAFGEYAAALLKGNTLDPAASKAIADKLEHLSGIPAATWLTHNLRINPSVFRSLLLQSEGKVIGRFDGRVAWDATDKAAQSPDYDPSYSLAYGAVSSAMMDYLGRGLGYKEDQPYEILSGKVYPWRWNSNNETVNMGERLAVAMRDNPHLRVLVMGGLTDLAAPSECVAYSIRHLPDLPVGVRPNITTTRYESGHMFYLNQPDREKARMDLLKFIQNH